MDKGEVGSPSDGTADPSETSSDGLKAAILQALSLKDSSWLNSPSSDTEQQQTDEVNLPKEEKQQELLIHEPKPDTIEKCDNGGERRTVEIETLIDDPGVPEIPLVVVGGFETLIDDPGVIESIEDVKTETPMVTEPCDLTLSKDGNDKTAFTELNDGVQNNIAAEDVKTGEQEHAEEDLATKEPATTVHPTKDVTFRVPVTTARGSASPPRSASSLSSRPLKTTSSIGVTREASMNERASWYDRLNAHIDHRHDSRLSNRSKLLSVTGSESSSSTGGRRWQRPTTPTGESDSGSITSASAFASLTNSDKHWLRAATICDLPKLTTMLKSNPSLADFCDYRASQGYTALHWAAKAGRNDCIRLLVIDYHADINKRTNGGYTPLHLAFMHGRTETANYLSRTLGASTIVRDNSGRLAVHYRNNQFSTQPVKAADWICFYKSQSAGGDQRSTIGDGDISRMGFATLRQWAVVHPLNGDGSASSTRSGLTRMGSFKRAGNSIATRLFGVRHSVVGTEVAQPNSAKSLKNTNWRPEDDRSRLRPDRPSARSTNSVPNTPKQI